MVALKTIDPPLSALAGRADRRAPAASGRCRSSSSRRRAARPPRAPDVGRAPPALRQARVASRQGLAGPDPARRRPRAAPARVRDEAAGLGEAPARGRRRRGRDGRDAGPRGMAGAAAAGAGPAIDQPRHLHPLLRDQRAIAGIGRQSVDEILWRAKLSPFRKGSELPATRSRPSTTPSPCPRRGDRPLRGGGRRRGPEQAADAAPGPQAEGEPCPRCGTTIEAIFYSDHQTNYCPAEQTGGKVLADRRLSRLLK